VATSTWPSWHCPVHRKPLEDKGDVLLCPDGDQFQSRNRIPRFVTNGNYADAFGPEAKKYRLTQLDSYSGTTITRDRARRCIGEELWFQLSGKQVLEAGCGAGRFTEILLGRGACVTSIDITGAVDANQENFPRSESHRVAQADIEYFPFAPQQFDMVFCLGVIQNTPNPEKSIACLYEQVRPGGTLIIDHYTHSLSWYTKTAPLFRRLFRRLSPEESLKWTEKIVDLLLPLHKTVWNFRPAQMLLSRVSPVVCYYRAFPELDDQLQREWALLDTHGSLTVWYRHARTRGQIRRTLEQLGLQEIWCEYGGNGVEARGKRPLS
jgi:2-polyprenyl-3-methyl-5-hydroxy-6-metoxy-1,4-benzoquinol methylase